MGLVLGVGRLMFGGGCASTREPVRVTADASASNRNLGVIARMYGESAFDGPVHLGSVLA
jgi:hypothetical protein